MLFLLKFWWMVLGRITICGAVVVLLPFLLRGDHIISARQSCFAATPLHAEYLATLLAMNWPLFVGINTLYLYTDCHNLILQAYDAAKISYADYNLATHLKIAANAFLFCRITKARRQFIAPAHVQAKLALRSFVPGIEFIPGGSSS